MREVIELHFVYLRFLDTSIPTPPPRLWGLQQCTRSYSGIVTGGEAGVSQVLLNKTTSGNLPSAHELSKSVNKEILLVQPSNVQLHSN